MNELRLQAIKTSRLSPQLILSAFSVVLLAAPLHSESQGLPSAQGTWISNPTCSEWVALHERSKAQWATAFLSTMSMGLSRGKKEQKFKVGQDFSEAVIAIDTHCSAHPTAQASEAAAAFLN
jgi:hypothetical protein